MPRGRRALQEARTRNYGSKERAQVNLPGESGKLARQLEERGVLSICRGAEIQGILDGAQGAGKEHDMKLGAAGVPEQCVKPLVMWVLE